MDTDDDDQPEHIVELDVFELKDMENFALHADLRDKMGLPGDMYPRKVFAIVAGLCNPYTQPSEGDFVLSVGNLGAVAAGLCLQFARAVRHGLDWESAEQLRLAPVDGAMRFEVLVSLYRILQHIELLCGLGDLERLRGLLVDGGWEAQRGSFLPLPQLDEFLLKMAYYMACVIVMALFHLYAEDTNKLGRNPYLMVFAQVWEAHTHVVALTLEVDRACEEAAPSVETPDLIKRAMAGSSAVRTVAAYVLGFAADRCGAVDAGLEAELVAADVLLLPLLDFFDPLSRRLRYGGALTALVGLLAAYALFACWAAQEPDPALRGADAVAGLFTHDQLDEDVRYVFGFCDLDDDDFAMALRGDADTSVGDGRDWADKPRGQNVLFTPEFAALDSQWRRLSAASRADDDNYFLEHAYFEDTLHRLMALDLVLLFGDVGRQLGQTVLYTVAKVVKDDGAGLSMLVDYVYKFLISPVDPDRADELLADTPPVRDIRGLTAFELVLAHNEQLAFCIIDELLMCRGLRRTLIWFLTHHVNLRKLLINYFYELVTRRRGQDPHFRFSRQGALELSNVEVLMLLHELFLNAASWLATAGDAFGYDQLLATLADYLCLMVSRLTADGVIVLGPNSPDDFSHDLLMLLFPWVGRLPAARELYFKVKGTTSESNDASVEELLLRLETLDRDAAQSVFLDERAQELLRGFLREFYQALQSSGPKAAAVMKTFVEHFGILSQCRVFDELLTSTDNKETIDCRIRDDER